MDESFSHFRDLFVCCYRDAEDLRLSAATESTTRLLETGVSVFADSPNESRERHEPEAQNRLGRTALCLHISCNPTSGTVLDHTACLSVYTYAGGTSDMPVRP
jgi:hypothetical protein